MTPSLHLAAFLLAAAATCAAQSIQPVITEYKGPAEGKFAVTNNSLIPMVVVLEPRSFDVDDQGKGLYRDLDPEIHVELSAMSFVLQPQQTHYVFYRASAERLPSWFTVYATFSSPSHSPGVDLRLMLPHTVYLYSKRPFDQTQLQITAINYDATTGHITGTIANQSDSLIRVQSVTPTGPHATGDLGGFPLLPGRKRQVDLAWTASTPPTGLEFHFPGFTLKRPITQAQVLPE